MPRPTIAGAFDELRATLRAFRIDLAYALAPEIRRRHAASIADRENIIARGKAAWEADRETITRLRETIAEAEDRLIAGERATKAALNAETDARRDLDDLAIRLLELALTIGRAAGIELDRVGIGDGRPYAADDVDRLLEILRDAVDQAEESARYAHLIRARVAADIPNDPIIRIRTLEATIRRATELLTEPVPSTILPNGETVAHVRTLLSAVLAASPGRSDAMLDEIAGDDETGR